MGSLTPSYGSLVNNTNASFTDQIAATNAQIMQDIQLAFHSNNVFAPRALRKSVDQGHPSAKFPSSLKMTPAYHTPGTRLTGQTQAPRAFQQIYIDDRLVTHIFTDELDMDVRTILNVDPMHRIEMGMALADYSDTNAAIVAVLAARASATVSGGTGGQSSINAQAATNVGALNACIWDLKNKFDEDKVPKTDRTLFLKPLGYNLLASQYDRMFHRDLGQGGSIGAQVSLPSYAGFGEILMSHNIPSTNIASSAAGTRNTYAGDFTSTVGVGIYRGAVGTVYSAGALVQGGGTMPNYIGANTAAEYQPVEVRAVPIREAYGELLISSLVEGHGLLRPECAGEIKTA